MELFILATSLFDLNDLNGNNGFVIKGTTQDDRLGTKVDLTGDINGDGIEDLVISSTSGGDASTSPYSYYYSDRRGETYVVFGNNNGFSSTVNLNNLNGNNGFKVAGVNQDDSLGSAIAVGDVNGDGIDDLAVGAPYGGGRVTNYDYEYSVGDGRVYIIFGKQTGFAANVDVGSLDGNDGFALGGIDAQDNLGTAIASAGDINGDGFDDLAISAAGAGQTITNDDGYSYSDRRGETFIVFGKNNFSSQINLALLDGSDGFKIEGKNASDRLGYDLSNAGDINGDGFDDLVLGTPLAGEPLDSPYSYGDSDRRGEAYVIFGSDNGFNSNLDLDNLNGSNGFTVAGVNLEDRLGSAVSNAGDINGDGIDDLILGAQNASQTGEYTFEGGGYVIFGKNTAFDADFDLTTLNGSNGFSIPGLNLDDNLGNAVSVGDIDGDGIDDLSIGANTAGQTLNDGSGFEYSDRRGETYILYGKNNGFSAEIDLDSLNFTEGAEIAGISRADTFGSALSSGGDINNDGINDLVISAPDVDLSGSYTREGEIYVVFASKVDEELNSILGTPQDDVIDGTNDNDEIRGLEGNDTLDGKGGSDFLRGNNGNDSLIGGFGNDILNGNNDNDTLNGSQGDDTLNGNNGNDLLTDSVGNNLFNGGSGIDTLNGGGGIDTLNGGSGRDIIRGGNSDDSLDGGSGNDTIFGNEGKDRIDGDIGRDRLAGGDGIDTLYGGLDDDRLFGGLDGDFLQGDDGNDTLVGNQNNDTLWGNAGEDVLNGGEGRDELAGGEAADRLFGKNGDDSLYGNESSDRLVGSAGNDLLNGNDGNDTLIGNRNDDTLTGESGDDSLEGGSENDLLTGDRGLDVLNGGNGNDTLNGGDGQDTLFGGNGNDSLDGNNNADQIYGNDGNDVFLGGFGNDTLYGGIGNDSLNGEGDNDVLDATESDNSNFGQNELDTLTGGSGNDIFTLGNGGEVYYDDKVGNTKGIDDFARIDDLDVSQDIVKLMGNVNEYELNIYSNGSGGFDAEILYNPGDYVLGELIGLLEDVPSDLNITDPVFSII